MSTNRDRILEYVEAADHSPTVREIAAELGLAPSGVHRHLMKLYYEGKLERARSNGRWIVRKQ